MACAEVFARAGRARRLVANGATEEGVHDDAIAFAQALGTRGVAELIDASVDLVTHDEWV